MATHLALMGAVRVAARGLKSLPVIVGTNRSRNSGLDRSRSLPTKRRRARQCLTRTKPANVIAAMNLWVWIFLAVAVASIAFGLVAFLWADFRPLTDKEHSQLDR